jgi:hypothetical protein
VSSVLALTRGSDSFGIAGGGETMLLTDLQQIRVELVGLLERLASQLPTSKERKVFIINNVDQVSLPPLSSILISLSLSLSLRSALSLSSSPLGFSSDAASLPREACHE